MVKGPCGKPQGPFAFVARGILFVRQSGYGWAIQCKAKTMADPFTNQIAGLVRFSYPSKSGFSKAFDSDAEREAFLFDPARLERRFLMFERLTLPSLLQQNDPDFDCLFLVGTRFPDDARAHLGDLIRPLARARIVTLETMHHYIATQKAFATLPRRDVTHITTFRLDDDDALDLSYIKRLKAKAPAAVALAGDMHPVVIGFNRGFFVAAGPAGTEVYDVKERLPLGIGLAMVCKAGRKHNIFARNHRFVPQFYNTFTDVETPAFIRSVHRDNDSEPHSSGQARLMAQDQIAAELNQNFATSLVQLNAF